TGSFGTIIRVSWKSDDTFYALKSFNTYKITLKEFVNELKLHHKVGFHENIISFCGITRIEGDSKEQYSLVLEYADSGTLNDYLNQHFNELQWDDKFGLALQLASAVSCLHDFDIVHCDLHAGNVLIHQKKIKLADFGLSKKIDDASSTSIDGIIPYVDPKAFNHQHTINNPKKNYKLNKKSDIYSIGVLMWQISSGCQPFDSVDYDITLVLAIIGGEREQLIDGTPIEYSNLYTRCWDDDPILRPNMREVFSTLKSISNNRIDITIDNYDQQKENSENFNEMSTDINKDLHIDNIDFTEHRTIDNSSLLTRISLIPTQNIDNSFENQFFNGTSFNDPSLL
ncbi:18020_t:CDS:2, partial [Funneliformis geosporum]